MNLFFQVLSLQNFIFFLPYSLHHHIFSLRSNYLSVYGISELLKFFLFLLLYLQIPLRSEVDWLPGLWLLLLHIVFDLPRIVINVLQLLWSCKWIGIGFFHHYYYYYYSTHIELFLSLIKYYQISCCFEKYLQIFLV